MSNATCAAMICAGQKMMLAQSVDCLFTPKSEKTQQKKPPNTRSRDTFGGKFA